MPTQTRIVSPGPRDMTVRTEDGQVLPIPPGWELLPPGDAGLTRRVKAAGPTWAVQEKRGRKIFSRGVWAAADQIARCRRSIERTRATPEHARRLESDRARRARAQDDYVVDFTRSVTAFLAFHPRHAEVAETLAERVATHATPVGSGTVARTARIPVAERAEAAVIAWLRHQTTAYDHMHIPRVRGERREVRRKLAQRSRELLERYRRGDAPAEGCPLAAALAQAPEAGERPAASRSVRHVPTTYASKPAPAPTTYASKPAPAPTTYASKPAPAPTTPASKPAPTPTTYASKPAPAPTTPATRPAPAPTTIPRAVTQAAVSRAVATPDEDRAAKQRAVRERLARRGRG